MFVCFFLRPALAAEALRGISAARWWIRCAAPTGLGSRARPASCRGLSAFLALALLVVSLDVAGATPRMRLTLSECIRLALVANPDLLVRRVDVQLARLQTDVELGAFTPSFGANSGYGLTQPAGEQDITAHSFSYRAGLNGLFRFGLRYALDLNGTIEWPGAGAGNFGSLHANGLGLQLTQPLLRGRGWEVGSVQIEVARIGHRQSLIGLRSEINQLLLRVVQTYWGLAVQERQYEIARSSLRMSEKQLESARRSLALGQVSRRDLHETESIIEERRLAVLSARRSLVEARNAMRELIYLPGHRRAGDRRLVRAAIEAADEPQVDPVQRPLKELIAAALRRRPELLLTRDTLASQRVQLVAAENAALPQLDFSANVSAASSASGGYQPFDQEDPPAGSLTGGHGTAWGQVFRFRYPRVFFNLSLDLPLSSVVREQQAIRQRLEVKRTRRQYQALRGSTEIAVRDAYQRLQLTHRQLEIQQRVIQLARQAVRTAEKKFRAGVGAGFSVLRTQETLVDALRFSVQLQIEMTLARAALEAVIGTLPEYLGVRLRS